MKLFAAILFLLAAQASVAQVTFNNVTLRNVSLSSTPSTIYSIPEDRRMEWIPGVTVGVPGGLDQYLPGGANVRDNIIDVTESPYNADNTGATDAGAAVQSAYNAAAAESVIYLPAGTYRFDGGVSVGPFSGDGNKTIRGDGTNTIIKPYGTAIAFNVASSAGHDYQPSFITNGNTKASTSITVSNTPWYPVGTLIHLFIPDDTNIFSVYGFQNNRRQNSIVTDIDGNTLTISPGLHDDYPSNVVIEFSQFQVNLVGLEDMIIDCTNTTQTFPVTFGQSYACWMKGVQVKNVANYCVYVADSVNFEMRECTIGPAPAEASNHSGLLHNTASSSLVENNIFIDTFPLIEINQGSSGNVFAYNLFLGGDANMNHGPHNFMNLYEGNAGVNFKSDGYFGGAYKETMYRNWWSGNDAGEQTYIGSLNRFSRFYNMVGNIYGCTNFSWSFVLSMGNPNPGNSDFTGTQSNNAWADWDLENSRVKTWIGTLTTRSSDTAGIITFANQGIIDSLTNVAVYHSGNQFGASFANFITIGEVSGLTVAVSGSSSTLPAQDSAVTLNPSPSGFQEKDMDVEQTLLSKANYNYFNEAIPASESIGNTVLADSLFQTNKPAYFRSLTWPPFNPFAATPRPALTDIPAGYRYVYGTNPPAAP